MAIYFVYCPLTLFTQRKYNKGEPGRERALNNAWSLTSFSFLLVVVCDAVAFHCLVSRSNVITWTKQSELSTLSLSLALSLSIITFYMCCYSKVYCVLQC